MKKRILSLILSALLLMPLVSCSETTSDESEAETSQQEMAGEEAVEEETSEYEMLLSDVPKEDLGGFEFIFLNNISNFAYTIMSAEEMTGDGVNDAVYNRNLTVENSLNITITEDLRDYGDVTSTMRNEIVSNSQTYSCFWNESKFMSTFAADGSLIKINDIDYLDLDKPWWTGNVLEDITVGGNLYFLVGDIHLMFKESYWMIGFNKTILDNYQLGDPYQLVHEGTWTLPVLVADMEAVYSDLNGNGTPDGGDQFGAIGTGESFKAFLFGSGEEILTKNSDDIPEVPTLSDRFYTVYTDIATTLYSSTAYANDGTTGFKGDNGWHDEFSEGRSLFYFEPVGSLKKLRAMEDEFGIAPYPKYDEAQENYVSLVAAYAAFCGIPKSAPNPNYAGMILENLCAVSYGELNQAYNEATLNFKYIRDKESQDMLSIIFSSGKINLVDVLQVGGIGDAISGGSKGDPNLSSRWEKTTKMANKSLDRIVSGYLDE